MMPRPMTRRSLTNELTYLRLNVLSCEREADVSGAPGAVLAHLADANDAVQRALNALHGA